MDEILELYDTPFYKVGYCGGASRIYFECLTGKVKVKLALDKNAAIFSSIAGVCAAIIIKATAVYQLLSGMLLLSEAIGSVWIELAYTWCCGCADS